MPGIFLSYRREDSSGNAGRLFDILAAHFGRSRVFMDLDTMRGGDNFVTVIEQQVAQCDVLLAVIGERWLSATTRTGLRRLDDPDDFVRLEIAKALERNVRVIPVLVGNASIPAEQDLPPDLRPLAQRHAMDLRDAHFHEDAHRLIEVLGTVVPASPALQRKLRFLAPAALLFVALVLGGGLLLRHNQLTHTPAPQAAAPQPVNSAPATASAAAPVPAPVPFPVPLPVQGAKSQPTPAPTASTLAPAFVAGAIKAAAKPPPEPAPSLAGDWTGIVTYDWPNAVYPETFHFEVDGPNPSSQDVSGTASLFTAPHAIRDVHLAGNRISFNIQSGTETPEGKIYTDTHNFKGVITGKTIQFSMLTDSQVDTHSMIHFTVTKTGK